MSTDIEITKEKNDIECTVKHEDSSKEITQIENEEEEIHTDKINQEEFENITIDEVDVEQIMIYF